MFGSLSLVKLTNWQVTIKRETPTSFADPMYAQLFATNQMLQQQITTINQQLMAM